MKHYFYTVISIPKRLWTDYVLRVYQIKKNKPVYIGNREYSSGTMKGHENECLNVLLEHKHITKKDYGMSKCDWRGPGYYVPNDKFVIHII